MKTMRFTFLWLFLPLMVCAETVKIDDLYYNLDGEAMTAEVVNEFGYTVSGRVAIPASVDYEGGTYAVTRIGDYAFSTSADVTEVEIPASVREVGRSAFGDCLLLRDVYCLGTELPECGGDAFFTMTLEYGTLHVPVEAYNNYASVEPWSLFHALVTLDGSKAEEKQCAKPTLSIEGLELKMECETEGAECICQIACADVGTHRGGSLSLTGVYDIKVTARKAGYSDSEPVMATLAILDLELRPMAREGAWQGIAPVQPSPVLVQARGGRLTVGGLREGMPVSVCDAAGRLLAEGKADGHAVTLQTGQKAGQVAVVNVGGQTVKVMMR